MPEPLLLIALAVVLLFGSVLLVGPPYLATLKPQVEAAFDLLDLQPGQMLLELGAGDGKVAIAAAKRGINVVGIELNPLLAFIAWARTRRYGKRVRIVCGNYWQVTWPTETDAIFTFMLQKYMTKLDQRIVVWHKHPVKLASVAFHIDGRQPAQQRGAVYLYEY